MNSVTTNLKNNLNFIFLINEVNATQFCDFCCANEINVKRTTLGRVLAGNHTSLNFLSEITNGIKACFPNLNWITEADLISSESFYAKYIIRNDKFEQFILKLFNDLEFMGWVEKKVEDEILLNFSEKKAVIFGIAISHRTKIF